MLSKNTRCRDGAGKTGSEKSRVFLLIFLVSCLAFSVYAGTLTHELVWDDKGVLGYVDSITGREGFPALFTSPFATHEEEGYVSGYYRPVSMWSLWLDSFYVRIFRYQYHLVNILLHVLNTILVFLLIRIFGRTFAAFAGAAVFAVHPVHTESVAFVSGRTDLLAAFFVLLSVIFWKRVRGGEATRLTLEKLLSLGTFLFACLSKEVAYLLPGVLLFSDVLLRPGDSEEGEGWWRRNRFWILGWMAVLVPIGAVRLSLFGPGMGLIQSDVVAVSPAAPSSAITYLWQILLMYGRLLILPWPLRVYYSPHELAVTWVTLLAVPGLAALFFFIARRGQKKQALFAAIWILIFLLPALMPDQRGGALLAERFLYLPSVGFCLMAGTFAGTWPGKRGILAGGLCLVVAIMAIGTIHQNRVWKDEISLFKEHKRVSPLSPQGYYNLGTVLAEQGRHLDAVTEFQSAIRVDPRGYEAFFNMGNSFLELGRFRDAARSYRAVLRSRPGFAPAMINLGVAYMADGELERSIRTLEDGLRLYPDNLQMNAGLVVALLSKGDRAAAENHHRMLETRNPGLAELIGEILGENSTGKEAVPEQNP